MISTNIKLCYRRSSKSLQNEFLENKKSLAFVLFKKTDGTVSEFLVCYLGMDSFYLSDPTSYGLPLSLLQISRPALLSIQEKVSDKETTVARYTDDALTFADLKSAVCDRDFSIACESSVDVGYICKQCHLVFPGYSACTNHQQNSCFLGKTVDETTCTVKLVQTVYECMACHTKLSTVADYKVHCDLESHRLKVSGST